MGRRRDRLLVGVSLAVIMGASAPVVGLVFGLGCWLVFGLAFGSGFPMPGRSPWPGSNYSVPTVALIPFLKDAQARGVLRTVGAVYQFRHATLQDQLAGQTTTSPATSPVAQRSS